MYYEDTNFNHVAIETTIDIAFGIVWGILIVFVSRAYYSIQYNTPANRNNNDENVENSQVQVKYSQLNILFLNVSHNFSFFFLYFYVMNFCFL